MAKGTSRLSGTLLLASGLVAGQAGGQPPAVPRPDLAGRWTFDAERSDDPHQKMREAMDGRRGGPPVGGAGGPRGGRGGGRRGPAGDAGDPRAAMRAILDAPAELAITPTEGEILILEKDGRMRTLHPDGRGYKAEGGASEIKARWEDGRLLVETRSGQGARLLETFELAADGRRLTVTLRLEGGRLPAVTVKRVYAPTPRP